MFRKAHTFMALAMVLSAAACNNSIVGPQTTSGAAGGSNPAPHPVKDHDKVCLDELRGVEITGPGANVYLNAGDLVTITFEAREYCNGYLATTRVSYDGGATWQQLDERKQATSAAWRVAELDGVRPILEVSVDDQLGDVRTARVELGNGILGSHPTPPRRNPGEHD